MLLYNCGPSYLPPLLFYLPLFGCMPSRGGAETLPKRVRVKDGLLVVVISGGDSIGTTSNDGVFSRSTDLC
jgi:hypothetical protein